MRIEHIEIAGFGKLTNTRHTLSPGLNIFFGNNETGKSTLQQALLALLYGFYSSSRARRDETAQLESFRPWDGSPYRATLEYTLADGSRYRVERDFSTSDVATKILELPTGRDATNQFGQDRHGIVPFAQQHLGLTKEVFLGTAFISQGDVRKFGDAKTVTETLVSLAETGASDTSAVTAVASLENKIGEIGTERMRTQPLQQARRRLNEAQAELKSLQETRAQLAELRNRKDARQKELQVNQQALEELSLKVVLTKLAELETRLSRLDELGEAIRSQEQRLGVLKPYSTFPDNLDSDVATKRGNLQEAQKQLSVLEEQAAGQQEELQELERSIQDMNVKIADLAFVRNFPVDLESNVRNLEKEWRQAKNVETVAQASRQQQRYLVVFGLAVGLVLLALGWFLQPWILAVGLLIILGSLAIWLRSRSREITTSAELGQRLFNTVKGVGIAEVELEQALAAFYERSQRRQQLSSLENDLRNLTEKRDALLAVERQRDEKRMDVAVLKAELARDYARAGITVEDLEQAWTSFQESSKKRRESDRLSTDLTSSQRERVGLLAGKTKEQLWDEAKQLQQRRDTLLANNPLLAGLAIEGSFSELERQEDERKRKHQDLEKQIVQIDTTLNERTQGQRPVAAVEEDIARHQQDVSSLESSRRVLEIAKEVILEATEEARRDFAPRLNASLANELSRVTGGRYQKALVDPETFGVRVEIPETGRVEPIEKLSFGTQELVSFYLRLTLAQLMSTLREPVPLVLDDCLVNVDSPRLEQVMGFLAEYAQEYQVLLFTQEQEIRKWFSDNLQGSELHQLYAMGP